MSDRGWVSNQRPRIRARCKHRTRPRPRYPRRIETPMKRLSFNQRCCWPTVRTCISCCTNSLKDSTSDAVAGVSRVGPRVPARRTTDSRSYSSDIRYVQSGCVRSKTASACGFADRKPCVMTLRAVLPENHPHGRRATSADRRNLRAARPRAVGLRTWRVAHAQRCWARPGARRLRPHRPSMRQTCRSVVADRNRCDKSCSDPSYRSNGRSRGYAERHLAIDLRRASANRGGCRERDNTMGKRCSPISR